MKVPLRIPKGGDRVSASRFSDLVREVNANRLLPSPGVRIMRGPNGTHIGIDILGRLSSSQIVDKGCWNIVGGTRTENEGEENEATVNVRLFGNQFYLNGEVVVELELADAVEDFVCQGELSPGESYTADDKPFVALKVPVTPDPQEDATLEGYATVSDLQAAQKDPSYVVKPLYKFTHAGAVAVDFRNCPALQVAEILS